MMDEIRKVLWPYRAMEGRLIWEQRMGLIEEIIAGDSFMKRFRRALRALAKG
jgi:hypothetical protein